MVLNYSLKKSSKNKDKNDYLAGKENIDVALEAIDKYIYNNPNGFYTITFSDYTLNYVRDNGEITMIDFDGVKNGL